MTIFLHPLSIFSDTHGYSSQYRRTLVNVYYVKASISTLTLSTSGHLGTTDGYNIEDILVHGGVV